MGFMSDIADTINITKDEIKNKLRQLAPYHKKNLNINAFF